MEAGLEIWMSSDGVEYEPALRLVDCTVDAGMDVTDVTVMEPMKLNPDRTPLTVMASLLMLRRPPPRYVAAGNPGFREFANGLRSTPKMHGEAEEIISGAFAGVFDLMQTRSVAKLFHDGEFLADAMFSQAEPRGNRMLFTAYVYPKE